MRIGLFSDTYVPELNGVANSTNILRSQLEKMGHEVYVIATFAGYGHSRWDEDHKVLRLAGMELPFLYGYVLTQPIHLHSLEEVRKLNLDVIHAQTEFGVGMFARICAHELDLPVVVTYHTTYEDYTHYVNFLHSNRVDTVVKAAVARLSKLYGDTSMEVIAPSQKTKDMLLRYKIRKEITVIPTGLPLEKFSPDLRNAERTHEIRSTYGIPDDAKMIIYVGRLAEEKALDLVIRGFAEALRSGTDAYLLIVGGGPDSSRLQSMIEELQVQDHIRMAGPHPSDEVPDYYRSADAFISASLSETQGMTFIEAMASGLPLFARRDEVLENLIDEGRTGWYFQDENSLSGLLDSFVKRDASEKEEISKECLAKTDPYSAAIFGQRVEEVYQKVITDYRYRMTIDDVKVKKSNVQLTLVSDRKEEIKVLVSVDDYYNSGLREGGKISRKAVIELQDREANVIAYQKCLNKISYKDRSVKEIQDWLRTNTECNAEYRELIVEKLKEKHFLDDERYTENMIEHCRGRLMGREKIVNLLLKKGISMEMIEAKLSGNEGDEEQGARRYAQKLLHAHSHDSVRKIRSLVRRKLLEQGYSAEIAEETSEHLDYSDSEAKELNNLQKCAEKAKKRYEKKYSGSMLRNRIFRYCAAQGYTDSDIYAVIDGLEVSDDQNQ